MVSRLRIKGTLRGHRLHGQDLRVELLNKDGVPIVDGEGNAIILPVRAAYLECGGRKQPVIANLYCDIAELDVELIGEVHPHDTEDD